MLTEVRNGIEKSFPGCRWVGAEAPGTAAIVIEIHRFASRWDGGWEAAAEWTVSARSEAGGILTEFETNEEVFRPNYSNAEQDAMTEAFRRSLERTVKGLRGVSAAGAFRPHEWTPPSLDGGPDRFSAGG